MNTRRLAAAAFALAVTATVVGCTASTGGTVAPSTGASPSSNAGSPPGNPQMTATVTIRGFKFIPDKVTIKKGGTVTWVNEDDVKHDATPKGNTGFTATKLLAKGESGSATFAAAGTLDYSCSVHPAMTGTVTVVE